MYLVITLSNNAHNPCQLFSQPPDSLCYVTIVKSVDRRVISSYWVRIINKPDQSECWKWIEGWM